MNNLILFVFFPILLSCNSKQEKNLTTSDTVHWIKDTGTVSINDEQLELCGKAQILKSDSLFLVSGEIKCDYRIFGYSNVDTSSEKLILFSVFTKDVQNNPYKCRLGSYYRSHDLDSSQIKYIKDTAKFVKTTLFRKDGKEFNIFFPSGYIQFINI